MFYGFNFGPFCVPLNGQSWDMTPSEHNLSRKLFEGYENWAWTQMQKVGTKYEKITTISQEKSPFSQFSGQSLSIRQIKCDNIGYDRLALPSILGLCLAWGQR